MTDLKQGDKAPDFSLPADNGQDVSLRDFKGQKLILYFYPKDDTPGCTKQACAFRDDMPALEELNAAVIGISKDSVKKHENFKAKHDLNFILASDENGDVCEKYDVWKNKKLYGRTFMGIERTTFLIDEEGIIQRIWSKVKVDGHAEEVKTALNALQQAA